MADYPSAIHTAVSYTDGVDYPQAAHRNLIDAEVEAIETELGTDVAGTQTNLKTRLAKTLSDAGFLDFAASTELTIASGSVTPTQNFHRIDTESDAASDDLDTIVSSGVTDGFVLVVRAENAARTVVIKHNTGNIVTTTAGDISLTETYQKCILVYDSNLTKWIASAPIAASTTQVGEVELSTIAETDTGTDPARAVSPDALAGSIHGTVAVGLLIADANTTPTTGDGKVHFVVPAKMNGMNLVAQIAVVTTVSSSGTPTFPVRRERSGSAVDMFSTNPTIDANEKTSATAATPAVINTSNDDVATGDIIYADLDVSGTGAKGHQIVLSFQLP